VSAPLAWDSAEDAAFANALALSDPIAGDMIKGPDPKKRLDKR
jgi:hypothetical protein